ncbi:hypothetical protein ACS0TY_026047 [Phlomoides rotata]
MEGIREIARSYYERASDDEKKPVYEFYRKLDTNRDGKIRLFQFKNCVSPSLSSEDTFRKLDKNGDGELDFDDVLCLYYMEKKTSIARCSVCSDLLVGPYFSCTLCFEKRPAYDLCCSCYRNQNLCHEHSSRYMLDHHSLIRASRDRALAAQKTQKEKEMEELHEIAKAHYRAGSPQVQALAHQFYQSMDSDGDWRINLSEFITFTREEGYTQISNPYFFKELDRDGNGTLDFSEVMTLYYIIKSGRPLCNYCGNFIPGIYFSCVECFKNPKNSFHLCGECYRSTKCTHNHNGRAQFLDNYTLLQTTRQPPALNSNRAWTTSTSNALIVPTQQKKMYIHDTYPNTYVVHHPNQPPNHSNAIVPASNANKWKIALKAFEMALSIGSISSTLCTIL